MKKCWKNYTEIKEPIINYLTRFLDSARNDSVIIFYYLIISNYIASYFIIIAKGDPQTKF